MSTEHNSGREINREGSTNGHHRGSARQRCGTMGKGQGRGPVCLAKSLREEAVLEASLIKEGNCLKVDKVRSTDVTWTGASRVNGIHTEQDVYAGRSHGVESIGHGHQHTSRCPPKIESAVT